MPDPEERGALGFDDNKLHLLERGRDVQQQWPCGLAVSHALRLRRTLSRRRARGARGLALWPPGGTNMAIWHAGPGVGQPDWVKI